MENFSAFARRAVRGIAPVAAALAAFNVSGTRAGADPAPAHATAQLASTASINNSELRPFGTVHGVESKNPLAKDANDNYTNPDAITAHTLLTLYTAGAMRYPIHAIPGYDDTWDFEGRFEATDAPGLLTTKYRVDAHGDLTDDPNGKEVSLVSMFREGGDHTKGIGAAVVVMGYLPIQAAIINYMPPANPHGTMGATRWHGFFAYQIEAAQASTTNAEIKRIVNEIEQQDSRLEPNGQQTVMEAIWATSDEVLTASRPYGGVMARFEKVYSGPQPPNMIQDRILVASLARIPYPPAQRVAAIPSPQ